MGGISYFCAICYSKVFKSLYVWEIWVFTRMSSEGVRKEDGTTCCRVIYSGINRFEEFGLILDKEIAYSNANEVSLSFYSKLLCYSQNRVRSSQRSLYGLQEETLAFWWAEMEYKFVKDKVLPLNLGRPKMMWVATIWCGWSLFRSCCPYFIVN